MNLLDVLAGALIDFLRRSHIPIFIHRLHGVFLAANFFIFFEEQDSPIKSTP